MQDPSLSSPCVVVSDLPADPDRLRAIGFRVDRVVELFYVPGDPVMGTRQPAAARWLLGLPVGWSLGLRPRKDGGIDIVTVYDSAGRARGSWEPGALKMSLLRRYSVHQQFLMRPDIAGKAHVFDEATRQVSWVSDAIHDGAADEEYSSYSKRMASHAEEWLDKSLPGWRDPTAFW